MNAEDLVITFKKDIVSLSIIERRRAIESFRDVICEAAFDDTAGSAYEVECCPRCGSVAIVKKGKAKNGEQRYLCLDCGRTFGMGCGRILGTSRLPRETWMAYAECFVLKLPLRECAGELPRLPQDRLHHAPQADRVPFGLLSLVQGRAGPRELAVDAVPVGVGVRRLGVAPAGEQQRLGRPPRTSPRRPPRRRPAPSRPPAHPGRCASRRGRCGRSRSATARSPASA